MGGTPQEACDSAAGAVERRSGRAMSVALSVGSSGYDSIPGGQETDHIPGVQQPRAPINRTVKIFGIVAALTIIALVVLLGLSVTGRLEPSSADEESQFLFVRHCARAPSYVRTGVLAGTNDGQGAFSGASSVD